MFFFLIFAHVTNSRQQIVNKKEGDLLVADPGIFFDNNLSLSLTVVSVSDLLISSFSAITPS